MLQRSANSAWIDALCDLTDPAERLAGRQEVQVILGAYTGSSGQAQVMTKGEISLALSGSGRGWDVGVSIGGFTITKKE